MMLNMLSYRVWLTSVELSAKSQFGFITRPCHFNRSYHLHLKSKKRWMNGLPDFLRPSGPLHGKKKPILADWRNQNGQGVKGLSWVYVSFITVSRLVLTGAQLTCSEGYHNVRMLLFRPFLAHSTRNQGGTPISISDGVTKCVDSAQKTIKTIYDTFRAETFFRTWYAETMLQDCFQP